MRGSRMSVRLRLIAVLAGVGVACGGTAPAPKTAAPKAQAKKGEWKPIYPLSRVLPDVSGTDLSLVQAPKEIDGPARSTRPGDQNRILNRMRITVGEGGVIKRADDLLPAGTVSAVELPGRLGGGFVLTVINGRGTQVYRADTWLSKLKPLVEVSSVADREGPIVVGFDRLYLRMKTNNEIIAIDPANGQPMPLGPLPIAPSYGDMVFVDGWRAVVETELRGVMATFDAGATWRTVAIAERVRSITEVDGDPIITVDGGEYRIDDRGALGFSGGKSEGKGSIAGLESSLKKAKARPAPLGRKPLRAALEDGYPEEGRTAVVIRSGTLGRVKLDDGSVLDVKEHATSETTSCHAIKLGPGFGFVCGEPTGKTELYEFHAPLDVKLVAEFDDPRVVTESGQGLVVISGTCAAKNPPPAPPPAGKKEKAEPRSFCVRSLDGSLREIRVRGNLGSERIVALSDGRVVVLVPPRPGSMGQISIIDKSSAKHVTIRLPDDAPARELETGMWLDGFQESGENEIGGWVEAGGPVVGVRIKLDGALTSGQLVEEDSGVLVSGPFGLALGTRGRALETVDGGMSWKDIVLPVAPSSGDGTRADDRTRRCGPVGCALPGTLRVGWADPFVPDDLTEAPDPPALKVPLAKLAFAPFAMDCNATLPAQKETKPTGTKGKPPTYGQIPGGWSAFRGVDPPGLASDEVGIDNGDAFSALTPTRAYVWGKKDSDWARTGRLLVRFGDRFSMDEIRSSAVSQSLWLDETQASEVFGVGAYGYQVTWGAAAEAGGAAAIVSACRPPNSGQPQRCLLMAVDQDRPVLPLRPGRGVSTLVRPIQGSTVRIGESWFFLADGSSADRIGFYRADLGTVRKIRELPRPHQPRYVPLATPHLVRRAKGSGLGLTFVEKLEIGDKKGERYVIAIDPDTGELGDPVDLGRNDLAALAPVACRTSSDGSRDGWLLQFNAADPAADVKVFGSRYDVDQAEVRVRIDQGFACVEAVAANADRDPPAPDKTAPKASNEATFPLIVSEMSMSRRAGFACTPRSSLFGL